MDIHKCPFVHWTNRNIHWTFQMPIRPLDKQKCPVDISNVHSSIGRTEMSSGHSNVHWTYCRGIGHVWRVCAWVQRFISNLKLTKVSRNLGPLTTKELKEQQEWWIKRVQQNPGNVDSFQTDRVQLNLQENEQGILECRGRIAGEYPIYLPDGAPFSHGRVQSSVQSTVPCNIGSPLTKTILPVKQL